MSKSALYIPTHRAPGKHKAERAPRRALRTTFVLCGVAAVATGASISAGVLSGGPGVITAVEVSSPSVPSAVPSMNAADLERRLQTPLVSRSDRRGGRDATKAAALSVAQGATVTRSQKLSEGDPRDIARALLPRYGFDSSEFSCLDSLYVSESNWRIDADNPTSSAYGIPQALTQLHELPADYTTSAESQIRWGLEYIQRTYGTPCSAWSFKSSHNWY